MRLSIPQVLLLGALLFCTTFAKAQTVANDDFATTEGYTPVTIDVLANDSSGDAPIDPATATVIVPPSQGTVTANGDGSFNYRPPLGPTGFVGQDVFEYEVCDTAPSPTCDQATVTIVVSEIEPPVAVDDNGVTSEDTPITIDVTLNDFSPSNEIDPVTVTIFLDPPNGSAISNGDGTVTYVPSPDYTGIDSFEYIVCDTSAPQLCDQARVFISVDAVNDPPVAVDVNENTNQGTPVSIFVLVNDTDVDGNIDPATVTVITPPSNGSTTVDPSGDVTYSPNIGFTGQDSFEYQICDNGFPPPVLCATAFVFINVLETCDAPVISFSTTNDDCGFGEGTAVATVSGGLAPYLYIWENDVTTASISGLTSGGYELTVTGANGCASTSLAYISNDGQIDLTISSTLISCDQADGTATATINGGVASPSYLWGNGETTATISGLLEGWYSLTVEDQATGCRRHQNIEVSEAPNCTAVISGHVLGDYANKDCIQDASSFAIPNRLIIIKSGGTAVAYIGTDNQGFYSTRLPTGTYTLEYLPNDTEIPLCPATNIVTVNATTTGQTYTQDFFLDYQEVSDLSITMAHGPVRPGFTSWQRIYVCNDGPGVQNATVAYKHDAGFFNFSATTSPDSYDPNTKAAIWAVNNLAPFSCQTIIYTLDVPIPTTLGTLLTHNASVTPISGDATPNNNTLSAHQVVTGSYDPNDKQNFAALDPFGGSIDPDILTYHYQVRFQNTGTDTAFTVVVRDEIEANLDITSIRPVSSSHDFTWSIENGNELVFFFENIMLPDSFVNEPASNGFVTFDIDRIEGLPFGTEISNEANIYFDFNAPVLTNTVVNVLEEGNALKAILGGPYDSDTGLMKDELRSMGLLPLTEPYANLGYAVDNIAATVSPSVFLTTGSDAIIDWLVVELRDPADKAAVIESQCALLQADGDIVQVDGNTPIIFATLRGGSYHIAIKHRNHLAAISAATYVINQGNSLDFTDPATTENGQTFLIAGDATRDGSVDASDRSDTWNNRNSSNYHSSDVNMNGSTDASDRSACWNNRNKVSLVP